MILGISRGNTLSTLHIALIEGEIGIQIIVLDLLCNFLAVDLCKPAYGIANAVLQTHCPGSCQLVFISQFRFIRKHLHKLVIVCPELLIHDLMFLANLMGTRIHKRSIFQMLIEVAINRIKFQDRCINIESALRCQLRPFKIFRHTLRLIMINRVRPEGCIVYTAIREEVSHLGKIRFFLHPPGNLIQIDAMNIFLLQVGHNIIATAILREPRPRLLIHIGQLINNIKGKGFRLSGHLFVTCNGDRIVRILSALREVEEVLLLVGGIRLKRHIKTLCIKTAQNGESPLRNLPKQPQLQPSTGRIGQHYLSTVDNSLEKLLCDNLVITFIALMTVTIVQPEETLGNKSLPRSCTLTCLHLTVIHQSGRCGCQFVATGFTRLLMLLRIKGKIHNRQRQHHLRK